MVDEEHGQIIIEELGKAVAETQQAMEQLADARAEVGDPTSADELRSMARRLVELGRGGWRDPMRTMPPQPPRLERSMLDNERAGGSVIAIPDDARPPAAQLTLRGCGRSLRRPTFLTRCEGFS